MRASTGTARVAPDAAIGCAAPPGKLMSVLLCTRDDDRFDDAAAMALLLLLLGVAIGTRTNSVVKVDHLPLLSDQDSVHATKARFAAAKACCEALSTLRSRKERGDRQRGSKGQSERVPGKKRRGLNTISAQHFVVGVAVGELQVGD